MTSRLKAGLVVAMLGAALLVPAPALAHNAAHQILPMGECQNSGAGNTVHLPPRSSSPHKDSDGTLDLIPGPGDQFGARFAVTRGDTPLLAGHCP